MTYTEISDQINIGVVLDLFLIYLMLLAGHRGYKQGLVAQMLGNLMTFVTFGIGILGLNRLTQWVQLHLGTSAQIAPVIALVILLILGALLSWILERLLYMLMMRSIVGYLDSILGLVFSILQSILSLALLLLILEQFDSFKPYLKDLEEQSSIYPWIKSAQQFLRGAWTWTLEKAQIQRMLEPLLRSIPEEMWSADR